MAADFADSECEASANPVTVRGHRVPVYCNTLTSLHKNLRTFFMFLRHFYAILDYDIFFL